MHHMNSLCQNMTALFAGSARTLSMPHMDADVLPGVRWGAFDELLTPAFWAGRAWLSAADPSFSQHRLGRTLREEVVACLLGGHGIPAEVGTAAFYRFRDAGVAEGTPSAPEVEALLREPLRVGDRRIRYRFARQRAVFVAECLRALSLHDLPAGDRSFRAALAQLPGIGLKTASWITRNVRDSDSVAILDIHICRACRIAGVFSRDASPTRSYLALEARFLEFACALRVRASLLDSIMWRVMRKLGSRYVRSLASHTA